MKTNKSFKIIYIFFAVFVIHTVRINSQPVSLLWNQLYGYSSNTNDVERDMVSDASGNIYITGITLISAGNEDIITLKYNSSGVLQWATKYSGSANGNDEGKSIAIDNSGNVYVTGFTASPSSQDFITIKYNSQGVQQWANLQNGVGNTADAGYAVFVDNSSNIYVTGALENKLAVIKYNSSGGQQWIQYFNESNYSYGQGSDIEVDASGNVFVTGSASHNTTGRNYVTLKYSSSGTQLWSQIYNGPGNNNDEPYAMKLCNNGNVAVTGKSKGSGTNDDIATLCYNSNGILQWEQRYTTVGDDYGYSVTSDASNNVFICGLTGGNPEKYIIIKYNSSGAQQWFKEHQGSSSSNVFGGAYKVVCNTNGDVYATGIVENNSTYLDILTVKYNSSGTLIWSQTYASPYTQKAYSLFANDNGVIYVSGFSFVDATALNDILTLKYQDNTVSVNQISSQIPSGFSLDQNYPNPFNPSTKIRYYILNSGITELKVFDITGREMAVLVNEQHAPGIYEAEFDGTYYSSGIYFYTLKSGDFADTKKMILVK
ncbi:MAG: SBBP repeat-containing protein [Ignavibacteria bacterium]|nr:SBBP repeat-containing protein [Ignavibacteria bacterium]